MNLSIGSQIFADVEIPLLWGTRAVLQDPKGRLSVLDLSGAKAKLEILGEKPAPGAEFRPLTDGSIEILSGGVPQYSYNPTSKTLRGQMLRLPDCRISGGAIVVNGAVFSNNTVVGSGVGMIITENGMGMGAPLPPGLAKLQF